MKQRAYTPVEGSTRKALPGARAVGRTNPEQTLNVTIKLRRKKSLPELISRPKKALTREQLAAAYGASPGDVKKVSTVLGQFGLKVTSSNLATRTIHFAGTAGEMEKAFDVKLFDYTHPGGDYRGRVGAVHVPKELSGIVQGVFGMDNRCVVRRRPQPIPPSNRAKALTQIPASWYIPSQLASHYSFPSGDGSGQAVGLLEFGGGYFPADLASFCKLANVAMPTVNPISTDGTSTSSKDGAEGEVMLDIEVVAGVCPKATIAVYFAAFTEQGWITILDAVTQDKENNPGVISCSWGYAEDNDIWTGQAMTQISESLKEAAYLGITFCVAAGDDGSSDAISDGNAHVDFPSSSPYSLAVGGTTIPSKTGSAKDIGWFEGDGLRADSGGSTGGGVSAEFARPVWQSNVKVSSVNSGAIVGRAVPDVAANADWVKSPYLLVVDGGAQGNGGTSAATPLWASLITLINAQRGSAGRIGYLSPLLYAPPSNSSGTTIGALGCTDVTSGQNDTDKVGGYSAGVGYDAISGWGVPNGQKLLVAIGSASGPTTGRSGKKPKPPKKKKRSLN
ncbi:MAG: S53 family peptidase [Candidatus Acidiferrales bacterium]